MASTSPMIPLVTSVTNEEDGVEETRDAIFSSSVYERRYSFTGISNKALAGPPVLNRRRSLTEWVGLKLGGNFAYEPEHLLNEDGSCSLTEPTVLMLRERVFNDLDPRDLVDYHCHLVGHGDSGSECYLHDSLRSWWYPVRKMKSVIFMGACQVVDELGGDIQYISRLVRLVQHFLPACVLDPEGAGGYLHGTHCLLPFDAYHDPLTGEKDMNQTTMYIPNEYALQLSDEYSDLFKSFGSVNPYSKDALTMLQHLSEHGVTTIKWLPNSMGIDPSDDKCLPFYRKMKDLNMALLVHCGDEHSVDAAYINNAYGNPLLLRKALDIGVKIIIAHCASEGYAIDIDNGGGQVTCFELFMRLMREDKYNGVLFGDISAVCAFKRVYYLQQLLIATDIHERLVYGSDYPVPAINVVVHTSRLKRFGLISAADKNSLDELYHYNPLLFDVASKRVLRGPSGESFPPSLFKTHPSLPTRGPTN